MLVVPVVKSVQRQIRRELKLMEEYEMLPRERSRLVSMPTQIKADPKRTKRKATRDVVYSEPSRKKENSALDEFFDVPIRTSASTGSVPAA